MLFGFHLFGGDDALYHAFFVEEEGGAEGAHVFAAAHAFLTPYAKLLYQGFLRVGDEGEGQLVFFDELEVRLGAVHADTDDFVAGLTEGRSYRAGCRPGPCNLGCCLWDRNKGLPCGQRTG